MRWTKLNAATAATSCARSPTPRHRANPTMPGDTAFATTSPFDLGALLSAAVELLTDQELAVLEMRLGTGPAGAPIGFVAIAGKLGISRRQAREIHAGAVAKLWARPETQDLAGLCDRIEARTQRSAAADRPASKSTSPILELVDAESSARGAEIEVQDEPETNSGIDQSGVTDAAPERDPAHAWRAAFSLLTEREGAVLTLRHGPSGGERPSFSAIPARASLRRIRASRDTPAPMLLYPLAQVRGIVTNTATDSDGRDLAAVGDLPELAGRNGEQFRGLLHGDQHGRLSTSIGCLRSHGGFSHGRDLLCEQMRLGAALFVATVRFGFRAATRSGQGRIDLGDEGVAQRAG
jgi:hypothetical protein